MSKSNRRNVLLGGMSAAAFGFHGPRMAYAGVNDRRPNIPKLRELAAARGVAFGAAAVSYVLRGDRALADAYANDVEIIVPDFEMKWGVIRPTATSYSYAGADDLVSFAREHGLRVRGTCLAWEESNPSWMKATLTRGNAERFLVEHIENVVTRYVGRMHSWDVVNEPIWVDHGKDGGLRSGVWLETLGAQYIDIAFRTAHQVDPKAMLVLNEGGTEETSSFSRRQRRYFLALIDRLRDADVPVHAVGLECHLSARSSFSADDFTEYLALLTDRKLKVLITELDVSDRDEPASDSGVRDEAVARMYHSLVSTAVRSDSVVAILTWELSDKNSWLRDPAVPAALRRADGSPIRALLYDDQLRRKPSWWAMAQGFSSN